MIKKIIPSGIRNIQNIVLFPHYLGQQKSGVEKTPQSILKILDPKYKVFPSLCNEFFFYNINNLYYTNKMHKIEGPRINIGGDHSMALSSVAYSINKYKNLKLIWIDAHADINTFEKSESKNYHGMPLAFLTGLDKDKRLYNIHKYIDFKDILYIGIRDLDPFEKEIIEEKNINVITVDDIRHDYLNSMNKLFQFIDNNPTHISFDMDAMDPSIIPSTGTPVENGFHIQEAINILKCLDKEHIVNMDITELNLNIGTPDNISTSYHNFITLFEKFLHFK
jgi:arginase